MIQIDQTLCTRCGRCAGNCIMHAISEKDGQYRCREALCFRCGQCVAICPAGAVTMTGAEPPVAYESAAFDVPPEVLLNRMRFRRSIRRFTGEKLTRQELEALLEAGRCAPTASNSQTVAFTILDREFEALRPKIWESFAALCRENGQTGLLRRYEQYRERPDQPDTMFFGATQMIAVTSERSIDGALALANMELLASAMELGALYCGFATRAILHDGELRDFFGVTEERHLDGCLIVGRTGLRFYRTAPRNPPQAAWK